jgi:hypothetical protein
VILGAALLVGAAAYVWVIGCAISELSRLDDDREV